MDRKEIVLYILLGLLVFDIFKVEDNSKLENLIIRNNAKVDSLNIEVKKYEYKTDSNQKRIDSVNIIIGTLPKF